MLKFVKTSLIRLSSASSLTEESRRTFVAICLGGLAAEYVIYGNVSPNGSDGDFKTILENIK